MAKYHGGVKTKSSAKLRRKRAYDRLEGQIQRGNKQLNELQEIKGKHESDPKFFNDDKYREVVYKIGIIFKTNARATKEMEILKQRI